SGPEVFAGPLHVSVADLAGNATARDVNLQDCVAKLWPNGATTTVAATTPDNKSGSVVQASAVAAPGTGVVQPSIVPPSQLVTAAAVEARAPTLASLPPSTSSGSLVSGGSIPKQVLSTTRCSLDYHIDQVGPSGVGKVEVWMTGDQGASWKRLCE